MNWTLMEGLNSSFLWLFAETMEEKAFITVGHKTPKLKGSKDKY